MQLEIENVRLSIPDDFFTALVRSYKNLLDAEISLRYDDTSVASRAAHSDVAAGASPAAVI